MTTFLAKAAGMFAVTNIDDIVVLSLFFARAGRNRAAQARIVAGQYLGFLIILGLSVAGAGAATLLPRSALPYLGLLPILLGVFAGWQAWCDRRASTTPTTSDDATSSTAPPPGLWQIATVTVANGGDNIGVYAPTFAAARAPEIAAYIAVFLVGVALWCLAGQLIVTRPAVAEFLGRWGHVIFPIGLIIIGLAILTQGGPLDL